jgi:hypothetical protein
MTMWLQLRQLALVAPLAGAADLGAAADDWQAQVSEALGKTGAAIDQALGAKGGTTMGSSNPTSSEVALARRLAEHLAALFDPPALEAGFQWLFDGTKASLANWQQAGPGKFDYDANEKVIVARPGGDLGLFFFTRRGFSDFTLRLQFRLDSRNDKLGSVRAFPRSSTAAARGS